MTLWQLINAIRIVAHDGDAIDDIIAKDKGQGRGNWGHKGRPGKRGGSAKSGQLGSDPIAQSNIKQTSDKVKSLMGMKKLKQAAELMDGYKQGTKITFSSHGQQNEFVKGEDGLWNPISGAYHVAVKTGVMARSIMNYGGCQFEASYSEDDKDEQVVYEQQKEQDTSPDYDPSQEIDYVNAKSGDVKKRIEYLNQKQRQLLQKKDDLYFKMIEAKKKGKDGIEEKKAIIAQSAKVQSQLDEIWSEQSKCEYECEERKDYLQHFYKSEAREELEKSGIAYRPLKKIKNKRTQKQIIDGVGGKDKTGGSCASLSIAYALSKAGYEVYDFRGGESRKFFASNFNAISAMQGLDVIYEKGDRGYDTDLTCVKRLLEKIEQGKQYIFAAGSHASVIRKKNGSFEYLQLQQYKEFNGWSSPEEQGMSIEDLLSFRFGISGKQMTSYLGGAMAVPVDEFAKHPQTKRLAGYINTDKSEQQTYGDYF